MGGRERQHPAPASREGKASRAGGHRRGAQAEAGDRGGKARQPEISRQTDGKGWRARPRGRKQGGGGLAAKGQEQMRAAGVLNRALDTENGNRGGGA